MLDRVSVQAEESLRCLLEEFQLPSETLAGMFRIESDKASCYIRVEEYKRPTFEVTWKEVQEAYTMGDSLQLEGTAKKFSGAPVQGSKVRYTLTRSKAWFWRNMAGEQQLAEGELCLLYTSDAADE